MSPEPPPADAAGRCAGRAGDRQPGGARPAAAARLARAAHGAAAPAAARTTPSGDARGAVLTAATAPRSRAWCRTRARCACWTARRLGRQRILCETDRHRDPANPLRRDGRAAGRLRRWNTRCRPWRCTARCAPARAQPPGFVSSLRDGDARGATRLDDRGRPARRRRHRAGRGSRRLHLPLRGLRAGRAC